MPATDCRSALLLHCCQPCWSLPLLLESARPLDRWEHIPLRLASSSSSLLGEEQLLWPCVWSSLRAICFAAALNGLVCPFPSQVACVRSLLLLSACRSDRTPRIRRDTFHCGCKRTFTLLTLLVPVCCLACLCTFTPYCLTSIDSNDVD